MAVKDYEKSTLEYYERNSDSFIQTTVKADMYQLYDWFLSRLLPGARILDLGCGTGRDTKFFLAHCYDVLAVDGSESLCRFASDYVGHEVRCMLYEDMDFENEFDGIWACASLLHVSREDMPDILARVQKALKPGGVLFTCFKYGAGEIVRDGRFFNNYTEESLRELFAGTSFEVLDIMITGDVRDDHTDERWLNVLARK